ncbi:MAG TPA: hypothetical protein VEY30_08110, partial [Myxococcaceae bacterium]|nr:hypothetical protein [Myxococcaceae bacterium]
MREAIALTCALGLALGAQVARAQSAGDGEAQVRPSLVLMVVGKDPAARTDALRILESFERSTDASGRFTALRWSDVLNP